MRILILDGSRVLLELVRRLVPPGVVIESATSFDQALLLLLENPPDAIIANVGPSDLRWKRIQDLCHEHQPPIPALFESCVFDSPAEAGFNDLDAWSHFLPKPYHAADLEHELQRLLAAAERVARSHRHIDH
jgi:DNA-binding response OmpR family regulator